jgi:hypothetical protein
MGGAFQKANGVEKKERRCNERNGDPRARPEQHNEPEQHYRSERPCGWLRQIFCAENPSNRTDGQRSKRESRSQGHGWNYSGLSRLVFLLQKLWEPAAEYVFETFDFDVVAEVFVALDGALDRAWRHIFVIRKCGDESFENL